jgi:hypothetical protein
MQAAHIRPRCEKSVRMTEIADAALVAQSVSRAVN